MRPRTEKEYKIILKNGKPTLFQRLWYYLAFHNKHVWYCSYCGKFHTKKIAAHNIYGDLKKGDQYDGIFNVCSKGLLFATLMEARINKELV